VHTVKYTSKNIFETASEDIFDEKEGQNEQLKGKSDLGDFSSEKKDSETKGNLIIAN